MRDCRGWERSARFPAPPASRSGIDYGFVSARLPEQVLPLLRQLLQLPPETELPLALECDDVFVLKQIALDSDRILMTTRATVFEDIRAGLLVELPVGRPDNIFADMGVVSLAGRTLSPAASLLTEQMRDRLARHPDGVMGLMT